MYWMLLPLRRYADFSGRSRRKEYWMFILAQVIFGFVISVPLILCAVVYAGEGAVAVAQLTIGLAVFVSLALVVPNIALIVRRFHDVGKSGWFYFLSFIPFLGGLIVLFFMCVEGTVGDNAYGVDPKQVKAP